MSIIEEPCLVRIVPEQSLEELGIKSGATNADNLLLDVPCDLRFSAVCAVKIPSAIESKSDQMTGNSGSWPGCAMKDRKFHNESPHPPPKKECITAECCAKHIETMHPQYKGWQFDSKKKICTGVMELEVEEPNDLERWYCGAISCQPFESSDWKILEYTNAFVKETEASQSYEEAKEECENQIITVYDTEHKAGLASLILTDSSSAFHWVKHKFPTVSAFWIPFEVKENTVTPKDHAVNVETMVGVNPEVASSWYAYFLVV